MTNARMASRRRMRVRDLTRVASVGLRTRKLRAGLSALGITIGVTAIVAVLGLSASSSAGLQAELSKLGTNLLTVTNGTSALGQPAELPETAPGMIGRIGPVTDVQDTGALSINAYRSPLIPAIDTNGINVEAASLGLLSAVGTTTAHGTFLNTATAREPTAVLGAATVARLGIDRIWAPGMRIWLGGQWFYVVGILKPAVLVPGIDSAVLVGFPAAETYFHFDGHPSTIYVRADPSRIQAIQPLLALAANPEAPTDVSVGQPSSALIAQLDALSALNGLFLGLGAVALIVAGVGVANIMVISVLERRSEIGLRRALGATKGNIRVQFLAESVLLTLTGGIGGVVLGAAATAIYASAKGWAVVVPSLAWEVALGATILIGTIAGLFPALRAARLSPTEALWSI